ncbi:carbon-nitrogen hydrolase family protein [Candidatus Thioglobus sp.]|nr:carbon-nitrogen hydrolase family protein [Candidatus Thioglobus sp.]
MKINAGIFQYKMRDETPLRRVQRLEEKLQQTDGLDLIVCPELFLSGYGSFDKIKEYCEQSDGKYANKISALAKKYSTAILYGYPEMAKNSLFNSAQYFDSKGTSLANHRKKMLPPTANESKIFKPGNKSSVIMVNGIKSAIVICYELEFPELIRKLALQGVELIIAPTGQSSHWPAAALYNCRTRAFENGIFVIYANSTGTLNGISFMGESKIIGPDGLDINNANEDEKVIVGEINTNQISLIRKKLPYLDDAKKLN